jgi:hypothetical protein
MAETLYKIKDWNETFENNRTRTLDHPRYVNWPTKAGEAFLCLTRTPEGTIAFGVFGVLVQWMARRGKRQLRDGVLRDDRGPFGPERYSRTFGLPIEHAIQAWILLQKEGWLVESDGQVTVNCPSGDGQVTVGCPPSDGQVTAYCPSSDLGEERIGEDRRVEDKTPAATRKPRRAVGGEAVRFEDFWQAYPKPKRIAKSKCEDKWRARKLDVLADKIIGHVRAMSQSEQWQKQGQQFVPNAETYLNQSRWETPLVSDDDDTPKPPPMTQEEREEFSAYLRRERAKDRAMGVGSG